MNVEDGGTPSKKGRQPYVVANADRLTLSCKVPLDVADGNYHLTAISVRASDFEKKYGWNDVPLDLHVQIKGGEETPLPRLRSVLLK